MPAIRGSPPQTPGVDSIPEPSRASKCSTVVAIGVSPLFTLSSYKSRAAQTIVRPPRAAEPLAASPPWSVVSNRGHPAAVVMGYQERPRARPCSDDAIPRVSMPPCTRLMNPIKARPIDVLSGLPESNQKSCVSVDSRTGRSTTTGARGGKRVGRAFPTTGTEPNGASMAGTTITPYLFFGGRCEEAHRVLPHGPRRRSRDDHAVSRAPEPARDARRRASKRRSCRRRSGAKASR